MVVNHEPKILLVDPKSERVVAIIALNSSA